MFMFLVWLVFGLVLGSDYGYGKLGESSTVKSAQSKKCRLLKKVESGEIGLSDARLIWEGDSGLRGVCSWGEVLDRKSGRSSGRRNGSKRFKMIKWVGGDNWEGVAKIKTGEVFEDVGGELEDDEEDEELRELRLEVENKEREEREEEEKKVIEENKVSERERKIKELRERLSRFM